MFYDIEVTVGHCCSDGSILPANQVAAVVRQALLAFARLFGGAYALGWIGSYRNDEDIAFTEPSTTFKVYTLNVDSLMPYLKILAEEIALALHQECVTLVIKQIEGTLLFVKPADHSGTKFLFLARQIELVRPPTDTEDKKAS